MHETVEPHIKGRIHMDEKVIHVGKMQGYDLNAIDSRTKYVLAHFYVVRRSMPACVEFLGQIRKTCYRQMLEVYDRERHKPVKKRMLVTFVSDGFENYRNAFNRLFYRVCKLTFGVPIACRKYGLKHNNNPIERYNGDIKDRIKTMRDFGSHDGAGRFLDLRRTIHNFVNPHMGLNGGTPAERPRVRSGAEAAGVRLPLGQNKLLDLIKYVRRTRITKS